MIKKLRVKFIAINMGLVAFVLLIVFGAMTFSTSQQYRNRIVQSLTDALNNTALNDGKPAIPQIDKRMQGGKREERFSLPTFTVLLDPSGAVSSVSRSNVSVSDAVIDDAVAQVQNGGKSTGRLPGYELAYAVRYSSAGNKIAFVDNSSQIAALERQIKSSLIIGFCGLLVFFGVSVFLSNVALSPVERAWRQQKQFVADASHELKTPLTVILANTDILLMHPGETVDAQRRWVENTRAEGMRMKGLVDDLLYLARADAAVAPDMARFSLSDAVWSASLPFEAVAFESGVTLSTDIADHCALVGNEPQIRQLVAILLDNAIKYAGTDGTVSVRLTRESDGMRLSVRNTGMPIDPADLPHVFERFYRAEASRDRKTGGYGLGLSIAKSIAETHRAAIDVVSSADDGTTFSVEWRGRAYGKEG